jgi:hypothetical protein
MGMKGEGSAYHSASAVRFEDGGAATELNEMSVWLGYCEGIIWRDGNGKNMIAGNFDVYLLFIKRLGVVFAFRCGIPCGRIDPHARFHARFRSYVITAIIAPSKWPNHAPSILN